MDTIIKQPAETFSVTVDFTPRMASGEALTSAVVTAIKMSDGSDASSSVITSSSVSTPNVSIRIKAGTAGEDYKVTVRATTTTTEVYEKDFLIQVREL